MHTTGTTQYEQLVKGTTADIVVGRRILVTVSGDAVVVLPPGSQLGRVVTNVTSDSITIAKANNAKAGAIPINKVKVVDTTSPATAGRLQDRHPGARRGTRERPATSTRSEVILLPHGKPLRQLKAECSDCYEFGSGDRGGGSE